MSVFLTEVAVYLETFGDVGTRGANTLQLGRLRDDGETPPISVLYETPGEDPEYNFGKAIIDRGKPHLQVHTRGGIHDYTVARGRIELIFKHLSEIQAQTLSGTFYYWCVPLQQPFPTAPEENDRPNFKVNFRIMRDIP